MKFSKLAITLALSMMALFLPATTMAANLGFSRYVPQVFGYPQYLNGDLKFPLVGGGQNFGFWADLNSATLVQDDNEATVFKIDLIKANAFRDDSSATFGRSLIFPIYDFIRESHTFKRVPTDPVNVIYTVDGMPLAHDLSARPNSVYEMQLMRAFLQGWQKLKGISYPID